MKHRIAPIAIIIGLISLLVIVGCTEFNRNEDDHPIQIERTEAGTNPAPDTEPVVKAKPVSVTTPPNTPEDKGNAENTTDGTSDKNTFEGKIKTVSQCPAPQAIDYPDCNLTVLVELNDDDHTRMVLIIPCIRKSKNVLSNFMQNNNIIKFKVLDNADVTEDKKSIQTVDDICDFELEYFYIDFIESIATFSQKTHYAKKKRRDRLFDTQLILTSKDIQIRKQYMNKELDRLNKIIASYSKEDAKVFKERLLELSKGIGKDVFPYIEISLNSDNKPGKKFYALNTSVKPLGYLNTACTFNVEKLFKNAQAIASIKEWFNAKGIHLIVIPVPQHTEAFIDRFNLSPPLSTYNIDRILLMKFLLEMDVETIDIEPYIEKSLSSDFYYHNHPGEDIHFRSAGYYYLAKHIYDHLKRYEFLHKIIRNNYVGTEKWSKYPTSYRGNSFADMRDVSIQTNPWKNPLADHSPILLIGDSYTVHNYFRKSIAYFFSTQIQAISQGGGGPRMATILQKREKDIPQETKICFFVFYSQYVNTPFTAFSNNKTNQESAPTHQSQSSCLKPSAVP